MLCNHDKFWPPCCVATSPSPFQDRIELSVSLFHRNDMAGTLFPTQSRSLEEESDDAAVIEERQELTQVHGGGGGQFDPIY